MEARIFREHSTRSASCRREENQTFLDLLIKLLLAQRSHVKWMPVWKLHHKRNTTLQNDMTQKQADSVGHGNAQLIEYHLSLLFYLGFDSRKYI